MSHPEPEPTVEKTPPTNWFIGKGALNGGINGIEMSDHFRSLFPEYADVDYDPYTLWEAPGRFRNLPGRIGRQTEELEEEIQNRTGFTPETIQAHKQRLLAEYSGSWGAPFEVKLIGYVAKTA
jgi:hypothetical protein